MAEKKDPIHELKNKVTSLQGYFYLLKKSSLQNNYALDSEYFSRVEKLINVIAKIVSKL